jgi:hypothetical protein
MNLPADFDEDRDIDGADLACRRPDSERSASPLTDKATPTGDSNVDGTDFLVWQRQLGNVRQVPQRQSCQSREHSRCLSWRWEDFDELRFERARSRSAVGVSHS